MALTLAAVAVLVFPAQPGRSTLDERMDRSEQVIQLVGRTGARMPHGRPDLGRGQQPAKLDSIGSPDHMDAMALFDLAHKYADVMSYEELKEQLA